MIDLPQCRICLSEIKDIVSSQVAQPCLCKGTIKHVHQKCLKKWIIRSNRLTCQVCQYKFQVESKKEAFSTVLKRIFSLKSIKRLLLSILLYSVFFLQLYFTTVKIVQLHFDAMVYKEPKCYQSCQKGITQGQNKKTNQDLKIFIPLLFFSLLGFLVFFILLKFSQYILEQLVKDYRWCRRLREKKNIKNYCQVEEGLNKESVIYNFQEIMNLESQIKKHKF